MAKKASSKRIGTKGKPKLVSSDREAKAATLRFIAMFDDPTRYDVLRVIGDADDEVGVNVGTICEAIGSSQPATSHHLALLRATGVLVSRREGKCSYYQFTRKGRVAHDAIRTLVDALSS